MWSRSAAAAGLLLLLTALGDAQNTGTFSRAIPPDASALARLNLKTEWSLYLPIAGGRDQIQLIQTFDDQLFVQTRTGLLIAVDVRTGRVMWSAALGTGGYTNVYPVAANERFVFASNVTRVFALYRDSGVVEFTLELGTTPVAGLAADARSLYAAVGTVPGGAGENRVLAYDLPNPIVIPEAVKAKDVKAGEALLGVPNPVDQLASRYPAPGAYRPATQDTIERSAAASNRPVEASGGGSRSPSLAVVPRVTPPYRMEGQPTSPSLALAASLRQPYRLHDELGRNVQRTPSLGTIPPSVASALALTDLRPRGVRPRERWEYGLTTRVRFAPIVTPSRVWVVTESRSMIALGKADRRVEVDGGLWAHVAARPGRAGTIAYCGLDDGSLVAVDLEGGTRDSGLTLAWRSNIGGILNQPPLVTPDAVFASGDRSGVVRVNRATGAVVWRTDRQADRILTVNQDFAYVRERQGKLLVYDAKRPTDASGRSAPLAGLDLPEFNIPVENTVSDRLFLAADNGLVVCLRDASAKYTDPVRMAPQRLVDAPPKPAPGMMPAEPMPKDAVPPAPPEPKKD
jgi:outer membrane protein assembly factor BamB